MQKRDQKDRREEEVERQDSYTNLVCARACHVTNQHFFAHLYLMYTVSFYRIIVQALDGEELS